MEGDKALTKGERNGHLKDCQGFRDSTKTHVVGVQRNFRKLGY